MLQIMHKAQLRPLDVLGIRSPFNDHVQQVQRSPILPRHSLQDVQELCQALIWAGSQSQTFHAAPM